VENMQVLQAGVRCFQLVGGKVAYDKGNALPLSPSAGQQAAGGRHGTERLAV
jgi:hypothetical protein